VTATAQTDLDDVARKEYAAEYQRHTAALAAVRPGDADGIAAEFNHHLDRISQILADFRRRLEG
jgi:DNA-binding FadR family transcriptional regulator